MAENTESSKRNLVCYIFYDNKSTSTIAKINGKKIHNESIVICNINAREADPNC